MKLKNILSIVLTGAVVLLQPGITSSEPVAVRHLEGLVHGFLALRSPEGKALASGDLIQRRQRRPRDHPPRLSLQGRLDPRRDRRLPPARSLPAAERPPRAERAGVRAGDRHDDRQAERPGHGALHRRPWQGEVRGRAPRAAAGSRQRPDHHAAEERAPRRAAEKPVVRRGHAQTAAGEARNRGWRPRSTFTVPARRGRRRTMC